KAVREAARRRAGVEHPAIGDVDAEGVEGMIELVPAAGDEPGRRTGDADGLVGVDEARRHGRRAPTHEDAAGRDGLDGLASAAYEASPHELGVEPAPHRLRPGADGTVRPVSRTGTVRDAGRAGHFVGVPRPDENTRRGPSAARPEPNPSISLRRGPGG